VVHDGNITTVFADGHSWRLSCIDALALADMDFDEGADVTAPLPGKILEILVAVGAKVKKGDSLMILEAMKMEHTIAAPNDAIVAALPFGTGDQVEEGVVLITFEDE